MNPVEEEQYWSQRDFLGELLKQLPLHVFWKNRDGVYLGCNDVFATSLGLPSSAAIVGKTDYDLSTKKEESDSYRADDQKIMSTLQPKLNIEENQTLPDGRTIHLLTNKVPLLNKAGKAIGVLGVYLDITQRKEMEAKLSQAKKIAEVANETKTEFLRNMRHDFRTPFSGILGLADFMASQETDPEKKENLGYIVQSAQTLLDMLNEIMEFINIESGQLPILDKAFDIQQLLVGIHHMIVPTAKNKGLEFTLDVDPSLPQFLIGDRVRTHRILMNLISNAIKFTKKGYVKISARPFTLSEGRISVIFTIADSGVGIEGNKQDIVFERFNRLTSSYSGVYPGKGLGLRIVKQFLDEMDGECKLESLPDKGSIFKIIIPYRLSLIKTKENHSKCIP